MGLRVIAAGGVGPSVSIGEIEDAALVVASEGIGSNNNDTTIPTSAAVKAYADSVAGIPDVVSDTTPQLGGDLDANGHSVTGLDASTSAKGIVELAIASETTTGTDATRAVTPDALAGSSIFGVKAVVVQVTASDGDVATGDGAAIFTVPAALNGMNLIRAQATVYTAGTTNATTVTVYNKTDSVDMLSGAISIASGGTVGTAGTVDTAHDDVATNDILSINVDSVSTTAPQGLTVVLEFQLP